MNRCQMLVYAQYAEMKEADRNETMLCGLYSLLYIFYTNTYSGSTTHWPLIHDAAKNFNDRRRDTTNSHIKYARNEGVKVSEKCDINGIHRV